MSLVEVGAIIENKEKPWLRRRIVFVEGPGAKARVRWVDPECPDIFGECQANALYSKYRRVAKTEGEK